VTTPDRFLAHLVKASFPLHFFADRVLYESAPPEEREKEAPDKTTLRCQRAKKIKQEHHPLVFSVVLDGVWVRIIKKQRAAFLPGAPYVTHVHKAAFRFWGDDESEVTAYESFGHAVVRRNDFSWGENGKKGVLDAWDTIE
jgi:hypothetical protein